MPLNRSIQLMNCGTTACEERFHGNKTVSIEGAAPKSRIVINHFARLDDALKAYNSAAYKDARKIGDKYATFRIYATEGAE